MSGEQVPSYREWTERHYREAGEEVVRRLRDMADRVERTVVARGRSVDGTPKYSAAAADVVHEVHVGMMNTPLGNLIRAAARADQAVAEESAEKPAD